MESGDLLEPLDPAVSGISEAEPEEPPAARPLRLPRPRDISERRVAGRVGAYTTSAGWLPPNLWPELDQAGEEHGRLRSLAEGEINSLAELERGWRAEDADFVDRLKQAAKAGEESPTDQRTVPAEREAQRAQALDKCWAVLAALADHVDATVALIRERDGEWLAGLRQEHAQAEARVREAQRAVREAEAREWELSRIGAWLQGVSDDGPQRGQPAPKPELRPRVLSEAVVAESLTRPWHRQPQHAA